MRSMYHQWMTTLKKYPAQDLAFIKKDHTVVIAGPGSGKTRVLSLKMAKLLREEITPPQGIACLTYTRMMAHELRNRLSQLGVDLGRPNVVMATVHSFCLQSIVLPFRHVYDMRLPKVIRIAPQSVQNECRSHAYHDVFGPIDQENNFDRDFHSIRRQRVDIPFENWQDKQDIAAVIQRYEVLLLERELVDFDIIVRTALSMIQTQATVRQSLYVKYPWIAIDEYQDLGYPLYRIVNELIAHTPIKLFAIGDPDQSIFDFAGTDPRYLHELAERKDVQPVIRFENNFRSTQELVEVAKVVIAGNRDFVSSKEGGLCTVHECPIGSSQQEALVVRLIRDYQARGIDLNSIMILHRWRRGIDSLAELLLSKGIPFTRDKHPLYDRRMTTIQWLEDLAFWCLHGCISYANSQTQTRTSFEDLFSTWCNFQTTSGDTSIDVNKNRIDFLRAIWKFRHSTLKLHDWLQKIELELSLADVWSQYEEIYPDDVEEYRKLKELTEPGKPLSTLSLYDFAQHTDGIRLTTIHSSKGTESDIVIIIGVESVEENRNGRRLLYVGVTRARQELHMIFTKVQRPWSRSGYPAYPRYILELRKEFRKARNSAVTFLPR